MPTKTVFGRIVYVNISGLIARMIILNSGRSHVMQSSFYCLSGRWKTSLNAQGEQAVFGSTVSLNVSVRVARMNILETLESPMLRSISL